MSAKRNRYVGNIALILVLTFAWSYLIMDPAILSAHDPAICPWLHKDLTSHRDHKVAGMPVNNVSGMGDLSPIEYAHCEDIQSSFSILVCTNVILGPEADGLSTLAFTQLDIETGAITQVSSFLTPGSITVTRTDPEKIYLQNLSFLC